MTLRSLMIGRDTDASVDENGVAYAIPDGTTEPWFPATQVKVYVGGLSFVGFGPDDSPPAASTTNSVYQESGTEETYVIDNDDETITHLYVWAESTSVAHTVRVSFFG